MTETARTRIKTTSNPSPIRTVKHRPATRNTAFNREFSSADAGPESQAMQAYSAPQISTTMDGAGEISEDQPHANDSGRKLRLDLNLDAEVELKAKIHGDLTLTLL